MVNRCGSRSNSSRRSAGGLDEDQPSLDPDLGPLVRQLELGIDHSNAFVLRPNGTLITKFYLSYFEPFYLIRDHPPVL